MVQRSTKCITILMKKFQQLRSASTRNPKLYFTIEHKRPTEGKEEEKIKAEEQGIGKTLGKDKLRERV